MRKSQWPMPYAVATLTVALTIRLLFVPGLGQGLAGLLFLSVLVSAWYGGIGPGLTATFGILGIMVAIFAFVGDPLPAAQIWSLAIFAGIGTLIVLIVESMHSARRRAERSERWFSTALKSIGDAVIATDGAGHISFLNPVAAALTGFPEAEAKGRPLAEVFPIVNEDTRESVEDPVAKVFATGRTIGLANHTLLLSRNGRETPIADSAAPIVDDIGQIAGVILVFRDVSESRKAAELKERLAAIVESSAEAVISKDLDGIITSWNGGAERILGYTADEVIGKPISMLVPEDHVEDVPDILERIRRGEKVDHYETRRKKKDGTVIDVSLTVSPIRDAAGRVIGASKMAHDITPRKLIEAERLEAERRKDEFLAMLAHELRNPLSSITNAVRLFGKMESEEELEWAKGVIQREVGHLARLIDDLLDVSRITRGKIDLQVRTLHLAPVAAAAVESVRGLIEERKHRLEVSIAPELPPVEADPLRLEQVLVNLLVNAAKYTDSGGHIRLDASGGCGEILIKVRDTGLGIAPDLLPRIFDLFAQGDRSIARSEGGLGIGLTLVKKLSELHGGNVEVWSGGPGLGSEFTVRLPASARSVPDESKPKAAAPRADRPGSRVLVVDDNIDTARGLAKLLRLLGHEVRVAHDGFEAIEIAREHRPEIVLLDIGLPGMDGYQVAKTLRTQEIGPETLIIVISGYGQEEDRRKSREAGVNHHLVKPLDYDALMSLLARPNLETSAHV